MIGLFGDDPNDFMAKLGIMGMSTAGMHALAAASYFPDISQTFDLTASDFVWQGFRQGSKGDQEMESWLTNQGGNQ